MKSNRCFKEVSGAFWEVFKWASRMFEECFKEFSWVFEGSFNDVLYKLQECFKSASDFRCWKADFKSISRVFYRFFHEASWVSQENFGIFHGSFKGVSLIFHGSFMVISWVFQGSVKGVSKVNLFCNFVVVWHHITWYHSYQRSRRACLKWWWKKLSQS